MAICWLRTSKEQIASAKKPRNDQLENNNKLTLTIDLICFDCVHLNEIEGGCKAFGENIPERILRTNKHAKPLKEQTNNLVYTPKDQTL